MTNAQLITISVPSIDSSSDLTIVNLSHEIPDAHVFCVQVPDFSGFCFSLSGDAEISISGTTVLLKKSSYHFISMPAGTATIHLLTGKYDLLLIQMPPDFLSLFRDSHPAELGKILSAIASRQLYTCFSEPRRIPYEMLTTITEIRRFKASEEFLHAFYYNKIVSLLFQHIQMSFETAEPAIINRTASEEIVMAEHLLKKEYSKNWTLDLLAETVGIHRRKLTDLFRQIVGTSPMEYLNEIRLQKAFDLIINSHQSITKIARTIGYSHIQSFSRAFYKKYRVSPRHCRKQVMERGDEMLPQT